MSNETAEKPKYVSKYKGVLAHPSDKNILDDFRNSVEGLSEANLVAAVLEVFNSAINDSEVADAFKSRLQELAKPKKVKVEKPKKAEKKVAKKVAKSKKEKSVSTPKASKKAKPTTELVQSKRVIEDEGEPPITVSVG